MNPTQTHSRSREAASADDSSTAQIAPLLSPPMRYTPIGAAT
jgi:hypothetical protein